MKDCVFLLKKLILVCFQKNTNTEKQLQDIVKLHAVHDTLYL